MRDTAGGDVAAQLDAQLREHSLTAEGNAQFQEMQRQLNAVLGTNLEVDGYATLRVNRGEHAERIERLSATQTAIAQFVNDHAPELAGRTDLTVDNLLGAIEDVAIAQQHGLEAAAVASTPVVETVIESPPPTVVTEVAAMPTAPVLQETADIEVAPITPVETTTIAETIAPAAAPDALPEVDLFVPAQPNQSFGVVLNPTVLEATGEQLTGALSVLNGDVTEIIMSATAYSGIETQAAFEDVRLISYLLEKEDRTSEDENIAVQRGYTALENIQAQLSALPEGQIPEADREYLLSRIEQGKTTLQGHLEGQGIATLTFYDRLVTDVPVALSNSELEGMGLNASGVMMDLNGFNNAGDTAALLTESYRLLTDAATFLQEENNQDSYAFDQISSLQGIIVSFADMMGIDLNVSRPEEAIDLAANDPNAVIPTSVNSFDTAVMRPEEIAAFADLDTEASITVVPPAYGSRTAA